MTQKFVKHSLFFCMTQGTQTGALYQPRVDWGGRWEGGSRGRGHVYTYGWFMLRFNRKQQNSVKQLSFNYKINKFLKERKSTLDLSDKQIFTNQICCQCCKQVTLQIADWELQQQQELLKWLIHSNAFKPYCILGFK